MAVLIVGLTACSIAVAFDLESFRQLDPAELRAAEDRMSDFLEPGTSRLLREPANPEEAYVAARQKRLAQALQHQPQTQTLVDGSEVARLFWPIARATQVRVDDQGRLEMHCVSVAERLGRELPDFRLPDDQRRLVQ